MIRVLRGPFISPLRPPLKKKVFLIQRLGENIRADWDPFFRFFFFLEGTLFFDFFFFFQKKISNFLKKKKRICGRPGGHALGHPLDRRQAFFKGGLTSLFPLQFVVSGELEVL